MVQSMSVSDALAALERLESFIIDNDLGDLPTDFIDRIVSLAAKTYGREIDKRERVPQLRLPADVSATDILMISTALLRSRNLEVFELGMWQAWAGRKVHQEDRVP